MSRVFRAAEILIPKQQDWNKWSVVACDQYSSQPEYWDALEKLTKGVRSTMHLMLPEAYLESRDQYADAEKINAVMAAYLDGDVFETLPACYVYVERTLSNGAVRRGLMGVLDLECYDYTKHSTTPIRATEGTVEDRLPPRVRVRRNAPLEMPHIMVFIDDSADAVLKPLAQKKETFRKLYDFDLNCGGGHIRGYMVSGADAQALDAAIDTLSDAETLRARYGDDAPAVFAMGDGNHSLATAKKCWEEISANLTDAEKENHPARYSLVELVNIHDEAISFEPIHKVVFDTDPATFIQEAQEFWAAQNRPSAKGHTIRLVVGEEEKEIRVSGLTIGQLIGKAEEFCQDYMARNGGRIDYIHNDDTAIGMGRRSGCACVLLPRMEKSELFPSIIHSGAFPKKSFSIGHAEDKRYYLECRKIR